MGKTNIAWATYTCNVVHGCSKPAAVPITVRHIAERLIGPIDPKWHQPNTSPECILCYAECLSNRRGWTLKPWKEQHAEENVHLHDRRIREFARIPVKPVHLPPSERERIFVCSMGDIFHERVPDSFLRRVWDEMVRVPHIYMVLTKRPERAQEWAGPWPPHIWLGTTCGHPITKWRIECLRYSNAQTRFLSAEPLLSSLAHPNGLDLAGIHQVIVGGESGANYRAMKMSWAREVRDECHRQGVAFFFKQQSAFLPGTRPYLVEEDLSCWEWRQFPGFVPAPVLVKPDNPEKHLDLFRIIG